MKATSKAVKASRAKAGVTSTSFALSAPEKAEIDGFAARVGMKRKEALLHAIRSYSEREPTPEQALRILAAMVRKS